MSNPRIFEGLKKSDLEDIENIVTPALQIEEAYYRIQDPQQFREELRQRQLVSKLRKALEGIWGHDLPEVKDE
jgi:hypothetical protein